MLTERMLRNPMFGEQYLAAPPSFRMPAVRGALPTLQTVYSSAIPPTSATGTVAATGLIIFADEPTDTEYITLNGQPWTFVAGAPGANQTQLQGTVNATVAQLVLDLEGSANPLINVATYTGFGAAMVITHDTLGYKGNSYSLSKAGIPDATIPGPYLAGGTGNGPDYVMVHSGDAVMYPLMAMPYYREHTFTWPQLFPICGHIAPRRSMIINVSGCTHMAFAANANNYDISMAPLENRSKTMLGPPVLRTAATRTQLGTTAEDIVIPDNIAGKRPKYVLFASEISAIILGIGAPTGDTTAAADLPILIGLSDGPVILDVSGCAILRVASLTTPFVRTAALENGGSAE